MRCALSDGTSRRSAAVLAALLMLTGVLASARQEPSGSEDEPARSEVTLAAREIVARADRQRGLPGAHSFRARIRSERAAERDPQADEHVTAAPMLVEVRANGYAHQLVFVLEPHKGDVMLATPDEVWIRPRRLHRLTRVPPDLRMFNGATVADVTSVDVLATYDAVLRPSAGDLYELDLEASKPRVRYPRARYRVRRDDCRPLALEFMAASGALLKTVQYEEFQEVLGRTVPTRLVIDDHVFRDRAVVVLSDFQPIEAPDAAMFVPDYLLSLTDVTS